MTKQIIKDIESIRDILAENFGNINTGAIEILEDEVRKKNELITNQNDLITQLQYNSTYFLRILIELSHAQNNQEVRQILTQYGIDVDGIPNIH